MRLPASGTRAVDCCEGILAGKKGGIGVGGEALKDISGLGGFGVGAAVGDCEGLVQVDVVGCAVFDRCADCHGHGCICVVVCYAGVIEGRRKAGDVGVGRVHGGFDDGTVVELDGRFEE